VVVAAQHTHAHAHVHARTHTHTHKQATHHDPPLRVALARCETRPRWDSQTGRQMTHCPTPPRHLVHRRARATCSCRPTVRRNQQTAQGRCRSHGAGRATCSAVAAPFALVTHTYTHTFAARVTPQHKHAPVFRARGTDCGPRQACTGSACSKHPSHEQRSRVVESRTSPEVIPQEALCRGL